MKRLSALFLLFICAAAGAQKPLTDITPSGEYLFAVRDTCSLFMSVYDPAPGSDTSFEGKKKPVILFVFGGGFVMGERNSEAYLPWFRRFNDNGYKVITIDYRLALKGKGRLGFRDAAIFHEAIETGVEDLFSATSFIIENADALEIDPSAIVVSGSSAGAIISLQADWHISNRSPGTEVLPENFRYAGVMSFSGAVLSVDGKIRYGSAPSPTLFFHGTDDKLVYYKGLHFFKQHFEGSSSLAGHFKDKGYNYNIYRFAGNQHEIAASFLKTFPEQLRFLETNVIKGEKRIVDTEVHDPSIKVWNINSVGDLYRGD